MEALVRHPASDMQDEMLRRYCAEAEERIARASNAIQARRLGEEVCAKLETECTSKLVLHATRTYVEQIINEIFGRRR
ncbi:MAG TPA: hypothetical protein VNL69_10390 [Bacteroidota bacterium]|nr:hypothetical protein [Bacteroidota bacterium]